PFERSFVRAMEHTSYFHVVRHVATEAEAQRLIETGAVQFVVAFPENFGRDLQRGTRPAVLIEADATDPAATSNALAALNALNRGALDRDLVGPLRDLRAGPLPFEIRIHRRYNEEGITQYNIVPGLMGVVLTMTMVIM